MPSNIDPRVKGLQLGLDPRQVSDMHVINGENFIVNAKGPKASFGNQYISYDELVDTDDIQTFAGGEELVENDMFIFTNSAVWKLDPITKHYYVTFEFTPITETFPWSAAVVGNLSYFVKKGGNLIQYNPLTNTWKELTPGNTPGLAPNIYGITESYGRLIIAAEDVTQWSAIDDGETYEDASLGAGSQSLSIIQNGKPLVVQHSDIGYVVYTTKGILLMENVVAEIPFRGRVLSEHLVLINPYVFAEIEKGEHIFLTEEGFFVNNSRQIQPWQPIMGEFFRQEVLPFFDRTIENNPSIRFFYLDDRQWFFVSCASSIATRLYSKSYVLYIPANEWGAFNKEHFFIGPFYADDGFEKGFRDIYIDEKGRMTQFIETAQSEILPDFRDVYNVFDTTTIPVYRNNTVITSADIVECDVFDKSLFPNKPGLYDLNLQALPRNFGSLQAFIEVGLVRLRDPEEIDRYSMLTEITIGSENFILSETEDWNDDPDVTEDWNVISGLEDWGQDAGEVIAFDLIHYGTLDGVKVLPEQEAELNTIELTDDALHFTSDISGIYHKFMICALENEQSFALNTFEVSAVATGRIA